MRSDPLPDLDARIEAALRSEPLQPIPEDFHRRVTARLHVTALRFQEQRRFRYNMGMVGLTLSGMLLCIGLFAVLADMPGLLKHGVPGGRGYLDYVATSTSLAWSNFAGALTVVLTSAIAMGLLLSIVTLRLLSRGRPAARLR